MTNVKVMPGAPIPGNDPVPAVVEHLRNRLAQAERGEIRAVATACILDGANISTGWSANGNVWPLLGSIDWLKYRMLSGHEDD